MTADGFRPKVIEGFSSGAAAPRFESAWIKDGLEARANVGITVEAFAERTDDLEPGWRPVEIDGYWQDETRRIAAIWIEDEAQLKWTTSTAIAPEDFQLEVEKKSGNELQPLFVDVDQQREKLR